MDGTVLVADDDRTIRTVLTQAFTRAGCRVHATSSLVTLMRWVEEGRGDLVISDVVMPDGNGLETLPRISRLRPGLPVIVISAQNTIMTAIEAEKAEAYDYMPKPFDLPDLMKRSARALERRRREPAAPAAAAGTGDALPLVGRTPAMQALYQLVARVLNSELSVLILGESGTGKSLIARTIHDFSDRRGLPFVVAGAESLEDADAMQGLLSRAGAGSILFDEIADLSASAQARLVRSLDALGDSPPRLMATSLRPLQQEAAAPDAVPAVRPDLYYRLGAVTLEVPPLRARIDDIALLATHFLARLNGDAERGRYLSDAALEALRRYSWPGNVRQLENTLRRLAVTCTEPEIGAGDVAAALGASAGPGPGAGGAGGERLSDSIAAHLRRYFDLHGDALPPAGLYGRILREMERPLLEIALEATGGNQARCAQLLGINRNTLRKKITGQDIRVTRRRKLM